MDDKKHIVGNTFREFVYYAIWYLIIVMMIIKQQWEKQHRRWMNRIFDITQTGTEKAASYGLKRFSGGGYTG